MVDREMSFRTIKRVLAAVSCGLAITTAMIPSIALASVTLSPQQQSQAAELATKLLAIIKALPAHSSVGVYEGAMADAVSGYSPDVVDAALEQVAGTPGLPKDASVAANHLDRFYADNNSDRGAGARGGTFGSTPNGIGEPGYGGGGGGSNYSK